MICSPCKQGATWNGRWRATREAMFLDQAAQEHAACTHCPCQHAIGIDSLVVAPT